MEQLVYKRPESIKEDFKIPFCPGCDHGVAVRLVAEVLDELGLREKTIGVASVGCSVCSYISSTVIIFPAGLPKNSTGIFFTPARLDFIS